MNTILELQNYSVQRGSFMFQPCNLKIKQGEILAIVGKTGSGKTVLMESLAGFLSGSAGQVLLYGKEIHQVNLKERRIGFVYQDYLLFPHLTVYENIAYCLRMQKSSKDKVDKKVTTLAKMLSLCNQLSQYPDTLSGGEQQRTALARAIAAEPQLLFLDEPFSSVDPSTRQVLYKELHDIHKKLKCTIILVTHDFKEAVNLAHRVAVIDSGKLVGIRKSSELFVRWNNQEVNFFLGLEEIE